MDLDIGHLSILAWDFMLSICCRRVSLSIVTGGSDWGWLSLLAASFSTPTYTDIYSSVSLYRALKYSDLCNNMHYMYTCVNILLRTLELYSFLFVFLRIYSFHQHPTARKCSIRSEAPVCHVRCRWECDSPTSCSTSCRPSGKPSLPYSHHVNIITRTAVMRLNTSSQFISAKTTHKLSNTLFVSHNLTVQSCGLQPTTFV